MTNPWLDAASNETWSESAFSMEEANVSRSVRKQRRELQQRRLELEHDEDSCGFRTLRSTVRFLHIMDGVVGLTLLIYGLVISGCPARTAVAFVFVTSAMLLIRAVVGLAALYTTLCQRYGLVMSANLSPIFGLVLFVLSMLCLGLHEKVFNYLEKHAHQLHLSSKCVEFWSRHEHFVWVTLLVFSVLEALRWMLINRLRQRLLLMDDTEGIRNRSPLRPSRRPWWWRRNENNNDGLADPLLSRGLEPHWSSVRGSGYEIHDGVADLQRAETQRRRGWLSRMFGWNHDDDDVSSVDFASVHEEWASRSEEDPLWWSREEDGGVIQQEEGAAEGNKDLTKENDGKDPAWVEHTTL